MEASVTLNNHRSREEAQALILSVQDVLVKHIPDIETLADIGADLHRVADKANLA
jgi:hypothetical protein